MCQIGFDLSEKKSREHCGKKKILCLYNFRSNKVKGERNRTKLKVHFLYKSNEIRVESLYESNKASESLYNFTHYRTTKLKPVPNEYTYICIRYFLDLFIQMVENVIDKACMIIERLVFYATFSIILVMSRLQLTLSPTFLGLISTRLGFRSVLQMDSLTRLDSLNIERSGEQDYS